MSQADPLAGLRDQIRAATDAAERLVRDARADPPAPRQPDGPGAGGLAAEVAALARLLEVLRDLLPADLEQQLADLIRQLLRVLRALVDWALVRLETGEPGRRAEVEDIPIR